MISEVSAPRSCRTEDHGVDTAGTDRLGDDQRLSFGGAWVAAAGERLEHLRPQPAPIAAAGDRAAKPAAHRAAAGPGPTGHARDAINVPACRASRARAAPLDSEAMTFRYPPRSRTSRPPTATWPDRPAAPTMSSYRASRSAATAAVTITK
jgi:hypothetical protein